MWFQSVLTAVPVDSNKGATPPSLSCSLLPSFSPSLLLLSSLYQNILLHDKSEPTSTLLQNYVCKVSKVWGDPWGFIKKTINERRKCFLYKINWFRFGSPQAPEVGPLTHPWQSKPLLLRNLHWGLYSRIAPTNQTQMAELTEIQWRELKQLKQWRLDGKVTRSRLWLKFLPKLKLCRVDGKVTRSRLWLKQSPKLKL